MVLFGFFTLILVGVYWINQAVRLFDQLISDGQSADVFLEITALTLPGVIRIVLPIAAFAASLYVANRLTSDSELVVVQFTGCSRWRMMRPAIAFGIVVALLVSLLTHFAVPMAAKRLAERQDEISGNVTSRLLTEGQFLHPGDGITFYVRDITPAGELDDIFLMDTRGPDQNVTYTAGRALMIRHETGSKLVMFDGIIQTLSDDGRRLAVTSFDEFAYDISALVEQRQPNMRGLGELTTAELLWPDSDLIQEVGQPLATLLAEGHGRISQALISIVAALAGYAALMLGSFSRFGFLKQIIGATVSLIVLKMADNLLGDAASSSATLWPLAYFSTVLGLAAVAAVVFVADRPKLLRHRPRMQPT